MEIQIDLVADCKNNCIFCDNHFLDSKKKYNKQNIEYVKRIILEGNNTKEGDFYIGGEEPFNSPLLEETVNFIKNNSFKKIIIKTSAIIENISNISDNLLERIDIIQLPIHSIKKEELNYIYKNQNAFLKYLDFLKFLKYKKLTHKLRFHVLILKQNYDKIENILLFLNKYFEINNLVLVYPIAPNISDSRTYYEITVTKEIILEKYKDFISSGKIRLINFY